MTSRYCGAALAVLRTSQPRASKEGVDQRLADVGFLDAGREKRLPVGREVLAQLGDFLFALVKRLAHRCNVSISSRSAAASRTCRDLSVSLGRDGSNRQLEQQITLIVLAPHLEHGELGLPSTK